MESKSFFRTFGIILLSAVVNTICLVAVLGFPLPRVFSAHDPETKQFLKMMRAEVTPPVAHQPLQDIPLPPVAEEKPKAHPVAKNLRKPHKRVVTETKTAVKERKATKAEPKVVEVNFDKDTSQQTESVKQTESTKEPDEKLTPVEDRFAGVQAADSDDEDTEAVVPEANPAPPAETEPAAIIDSQDHNNYFSESKRAA